MGAIAILLSLHIAVRDTDRINLVNMSIDGFGDGVGIFENAAGPTDLIGVVQDANAEFLNIERDFIDLV